MVISLSFNYYIPMWTCAPCMPKMKWNKKWMEITYRKKIILSLKIEIKIMHVSNWINQFNFRKMILTSHFYPIENKSQKKCFALIISLSFTIYNEHIALWMGEWLNKGYVSGCIEFTISEFEMFGSNIPFYFNGFQMVVRHHVVVSMFLLSAKCFWDQ